MYNYRMNFYFSALFFLLFASFSQAQERKPISEPINKTAKAGAFIDVNVATYPPSAFSISQLVTDVLIAGGSTCTTPNVSNVTVSPNTPATDTERSWGYFNKGTTNFPFDAGIVLVTGKARRAGNAADTGLSDQLGTGSDADLVAAINPLGSLQDATAIEFDFVPSSTDVTFNYIFASEEYTSSFPCGNFSDGFALLLKKQGDPNYTNLAILPAGGGPVSVTNIVPASFTCGPINAAYFFGLNPQATATVTNLNGRTVPLTATATVIPGATYHFKMVIADAVDRSFDSAVFLEAGSFNIGVQILDPTGVALPPQIQQCNNAPKVLTASVQSTTVTYQWLLNGAPIAGATNATYTAVQPGIYTVEVTVPGNSCPGTAQVEIIGGTSPTVQNALLTACYGVGNVPFNLTGAQSAISTTLGAVFKYYVNQADAIAENGNFIVNPTNFMSAGGQTIYVTVKSGFCPGIALLGLVKAPEMIAVVENPQPITCLHPTVTLIGNASTYPAGSTFIWQATNGGTIVSGGNTLNATVSSAGTYTLTIVKTYQPGDIACTVTKTVNVITDLAPPLTTVSAPKTKICNGESITLTATGGVNYLWNSDPATGNTITVSPTTTTTYSVYAYGANGCKSLNPATITIEVFPAITSNMPTITGYICVGDQITLDAGTGPGYTYLWSNGATTQTITVSIAGSYTVSIYNGVCTKQFTTQVIQAIVPEVIDVTYENNSQLTITASNPSNGVLEYSLDDGATWQDSNIFYNIDKNIDVIIKVRVKRTTCEGMLNYFTFSMANVLTPNGDGKNDVLNLVGISKYPKFAASIYDRYGKLLYKMDKNNFTWDGTFQSRPLNTDTYWYQLNYEHPASKKLILNNGWIMIKNRD